MIQSPAANLGFVCNGEYPDEELEEQTVTLQVRFQSGRGYQLLVFLEEDCCPTPDVHQTLIESGELHF